jgi:hypothetical protein
MQHDVDFTLAHPVTPLRDCSPAVQRLFGYTPPKRAAAPGPGAEDASTPG